MYGMLVRAVYVFHLRRLFQLRGGKVKYIFAMLVCTEEPQL